MKTQLCILVLLITVLITGCNNSKRKVKSVDATDNVALGPMPPEPQPLPESEIADSSVSVEAPVSTDEVKREPQTALEYPCDCIWANIKMQCRCSKEGCKNCWTEPPYCEYHAAENRKEMKKIGEELDKALIPIAKAFQEIQKSLPEKETVKCVWCGREYQGYDNRSCCSQKCSNEKRLYGH
jgi:hypothetical protein